MKQILLYAKNIDNKLVFSNQRELEQFLSLHPNKTFTVKLERETGVRSGNQNSALHLYFTHLAKELNDAGYTVQMVLKEKIDLEWDMEKVKELLWRPAQKAILKKKSTTELGKVEDIDLVYEHLNRHISEKFGIHVPFPNDDTKNYTS